MCEKSQLTLAISFIQLSFLISAFQLTKEKKWSYKNSPLKSAEAKPSLKQYNTAVGGETIDDM